MKIQKAQFYSPDVKKLSSFYRKLFPASNVLIEDQLVKINLEHTQVIFAEDPMATPYHIAFNIPSNQAEEALRWLKQRVEVLPYEGQELVDFSAWKATSIYFYDHDHNIIELIARRDLKLDSDKPFDGNSILSVSEIGLGVNAPKDFISRLNELAKVPVFDGDPSGSFCALGDDFGLFIVVDKKKKTWIPTDDTVYPSSFSVITSSGQKIQYEAGNLKIY